MTISSQTRTAGPFTGTGAIVPYPFTFKVFQASDLVVTKTDSGGVQTTLALSTDYTASLNPDQDAAPGGTITLLVALAVGSTLTFTSAVPLTQTASLTNTGGFFPKIIEAALDRLTILLQQLGFSAGQTIRVPEVPGVGALPVAAARAGNLLGFDSLGNPVTVAPTSGSAASLAADLASTALASKNAGQVGFLASLVYGANTVGAFLRSLTLSAGATVVGWIQSATSAVQRTVNDKLNERISVFDFMTSAQIADVQASTLTLDVTAAVQAALNAGAGKTVWFPQGYYRINGNLTTAFTTRLLGEVWWQTRLVKFAGGILLTTPDASIGSSDNVSIENLMFDGVSGTGATAIGAPGGVYTKYIGNLKLKNVHFTRELANGIDADVIYLFAQGCTWGVYGTTAPAGAKHVNLIAGGALAPNMIGFVDCRFFNLPAASTSVTINGGAGVLFQLCDWTSVGRAVQLTNMDNIVFETIYSEVLAHATSGFLVDCPTQSPVTVRNHISRNSTTPGVWGYTPGSRIEFDGCKAGFQNTSQFWLVRTSDSSHALPGDGSIVCRKHSVSGNATDPTTQFSGVGTGILVPKAWAIVNTASAGTLIASSDPGCSLGRNGTGDVNVNFTNPLVTAAGKCCSVANGEGSVPISFGVGTSSVRVICGTRANPSTAVDDIFHVIVFGT